MFNINRSGGVRRLVLAAFALLLGSAAGAANFPAELRIASIGTVDQGKVWVVSQSTRVQEEGWLAAELAKRGVKLVWHAVPTSVGGPGFNEGLANKTVDFASYGDLPSLIGKAGGIDIKLVVPYGGGGNSYLMIPANSTAKSIADLKGKRIAIHRGRPGELPFTKLINAYGLKTSDFRLLNLPAQAGAAALAAGDVDGYFGGVDSLTLIDRKVAKVLWSTKAITLGQPIDWKTRVDLFVRSAFAEQYPELTQLVVTAYVRSSYWTSQEENHAAVVKIYARPGTPSSVVENDFKGESVAWRDRWSPVFDSFLYDYYRDAVVLARDKKLIRRDVDIDSFFDKRFVARALDELDIETFWAPRPQRPTGALAPQQAAAR